MGGNLRILPSRLGWAHRLPLIHLAICLIAMLGYVVPGLDFLGILFSVLTLADIPVSFVTIALGFSNHTVLAGIWTLVAGTLWWFLLCLTAETLARKIRGASESSPPH
jgi:hypothetical protein